jgi:diketogulonate reductase-like aldo/keto reductase
MIDSVDKIQLSSGHIMPALGLGTWGMGDRESEREREVNSLRAGLDLGMTLVDTAEMYADGGAERVVGAAINGQRDRTFLVSKVYPHHATKRGVAAACERSLKRLRTDRLDLYLLHWRGDVPLAQTVAGFEQLRTEGRIDAWGVSNFDRSDMEALFAVPGGDRCAANQVLYHLGCRGVEWDLLTWCRKHRVAIMAYSPLGQKELLNEPALAALASRLDVTPAQLALAWLLAHGVAVIPKASDVRHVHDNSESTSIAITPEILVALDAAFPPPQRATPLAML